MIFKTALKRSSVVKMCKDGVHIKRRMPFVLNSRMRESIKACTVYVENVPEDVTQESLARTFNQFSVKDIRIKSKENGEEKCRHATL